MVKFIVKLLLLLMFLAVIVLGVVLMVRDDPGFVLLRYHDYEVETTLAFTLGALIVLVVIFYYCVRLLRGVWRLPRSMRRLSQDRRFSKSRRQLNQGFIDLAEGRFGQAENHLVRLADSSDSPLVHYLAAARAAQLQGKHDARDSYFKAAHEARPDAEMAIGVTQAELQLAHHQTEQALATLTHLHGIAPRHDYVTMLLARAYYELQDWQALVAILPDLRRKKLVKEAKLVEMEVAGYCGMLELATSSQSSFDNAWSKIPKALQTDARMIHLYLDLMAEQGWQSSKAEQLVLKSLDKQWDDGLIEVYGRFQAKDANAQLVRVEKWLDDFGHNENLLLALGRIAMRARLWGKAQGYLEASIGAKATPAACLALAELFEQQLQQRDKAAEYYQRGLKLSLASGG